MGDKRNKYIAQNVTTISSHKTQMIAMRPKPAQIDIMSRGSTDTIYITA